MATMQGAGMSPQGAAPKAVPTKWGQKGISEKFYVQENNTLSESPNAQQVILSDAGILSELQHHHYGTYTVTHGTGTNAKDTFGPYTYLNNYVLRAGSSTPIISLSGRALGILQIIEYPDRSWEANATGGSVENPLTNASDYFNYPAATGTMRSWLRIPVALKIQGAPGGHVGYMVLQNKRVQNVIQAAFNLTGTSSPWNAASTVAGNAAYIVSGNDTVTAAPLFETWKTLNTIPASGADMPLFGFTRYISEVLMPYSGSSFTYNFEPGGELLRATFQFLDGNSGQPTGMATSNLNYISYQYGTNKQVDVYTPYRNIHQQLLDYGRVLPQGTFVFDYYTPSRSLVNTKSTENTANVQVVASFSSGYSVPANSQVSVMTDKVFAVQNYLTK